MKAIYKIYFKSQLMGEVYSEQNADTFRHLGFEIQNIWKPEIQQGIDELDPYEDFDSSKSIE